MSVPAINITPDPWLDRCKSFPLGLPECCLWLAAAYSIPQYLGEYIVGQGVTFSEAWPKNSVQLCIRGVLTLIFLIYFFVYRRGRAVDLGFSTRRLAGDIVWGVAACIVMAALYLAGMFVVYLAMTWYFGNAAEFWKLIRQLPIDQPAVGEMIAVCLVYPLLEEFWFRALMYPKMRLYLGRVLAILFLSAIFGAAHPWPPVTQTIGGLAFVIAYEKRQTIYASIILHIAGNGILFVIGWAMREGIIRL